MIYGYARISTKKQSIQRQIDNIKKYNNNAVVLEEAFTGTTTDRPKLKSLIKTVRSGDTIVFDEVSRMSRNAADGVKLYMQLYNKGVNLVFLKEPHINTSVYKEKLNKQIEKVSNTGNKATDKLLNSIMEALQSYMIDIAKEQIELAFQTAQAEVDFLHKRTSEGVRKAQAEGKQVGRSTGAKIETKKAKEAKKKILELSKDFNGYNKDLDIIKMLGIASNTYYKYKKELKGV